jgi:hypothetical protein
VREAGSSTQRVEVDWIEEGVVEQVLCRGRTSALKSRIGYLVLWTMVG